MTPFRIPIALQWLFPTPLAVLIFLAPESPWWLVRKGRYDAARHSVERLGNKEKLNSSDTVAMMRRVIELEKSTKAPSYLELFKGTDLRRTLIVCGVYAAQNLTGNLIANQAVYFFERTSPSSPRSQSHHLPFPHTNTSPQKPAYQPNSPSPSA